MTLDSLTSPAFHRLRRLRRITAGIGLAVAAGAIACDATTEPSMSEVAGAYTATSFTLTEGSATPVNELSAGATADIVLAPNGTTTGELFIPGGNDDGSDFTASLAGSWTLSDNTVHFSQTADTFIRDMAFTVDGNTLVGDETFGTNRIRLTLTRQ